jgi:hypothetical protein
MAIAIAIAIAVAVAVTVYRHLAFPNIRALHYMSIGKVFKADGTSCDAVPGQSYSTTDGSEVGHVSIFG